MNFVSRFKNSDWEKFMKWNFFVKIFLIIREKHILVTAWKVTKYGVISGPHFLVFGLNTEIYGVNPHIQSEYRKIRTRNNSVFGPFLRSVFHLNSGKECLKTTKRRENSGNIKMQNFVSWLYAWRITEANLEPSRTSTMELFCANSL